MDILLTNESKPMQQKNILILVKFDIFNNVDFFAQCWSNVFFLSELIRRILIWVPWLLHCDQCFSSLHNGFRLHLLSWRRSIFIRSSIFPVLLHVQVHPSGMYNRTIGMEKCIQNCGDRKMKYPWTLFDGDSSLKIVWMLPSEFSWIDTLGLLIIFVAAGFRLLSSHIGEFIVVFGWLKSLDMATLSETKPIKIKYIFVEN